MKYLNNLFVQYDSFFETDILSTSMSTILNSLLLFLQKLTYTITLLLILK